jgi:hypothetical protein
LLIAINWDLKIRTKLDNDSTAFRGGTGLLDEQLEFLVIKLRKISKYAESCINQYIVIRPGKIIIVQELILSKKITESARS